MMAVAPRRAHPFAPQSARPFPPLVLDDAGSLEAMAGAVMRLHNTLLTIGRCYTTDAADEYHLQGVGYWNLARPFPQNWAVLASLFDIETLL